MIRTLASIALMAGALLVCPPPAEAAESYDNCAGFVNSLPAVISTQGTWCLNKDLSTNMASGDAITIATNNVTIDCNHFKIGGLAGGAATTTLGIHAATRLNTTVRNCNIRGFFVGVYFTSGGGHLVEDNSFDGNTVYGILVTSPGSTIRNNLVIDTGGSAASTGSAVGISAGNGVDILDNTVNGVAPTGTDATAYGIFTSSNGDGSINGNRVRGLAPAGTGAPLGIYTSNSGGVVISDNHVQGPGTGVTGGIGVRCTNNAGTARGNVVAGFATGILNCLSSSNVVNTN